MKTANLIRHYETDFTIACQCSEAAPASRSRLIGSQAGGLRYFFLVIKVQYERGVYLPAQDLWLDPWDAKPFAFVSHAHSDHIAPHKEIIVSERTARLMQARLPGKRNEHVLPFGEKRTVRDVDVTLLPAGHIFGSAQIFLENESLLYTGDFKLREGKSAEPAEWRHADTLIMETTFGLPRYRFPATEQVVNQIIAFCREAIDEGEVPVLLGYSLGKAQEILCSLTGAGLTPMLHGSVYQMTRIYEQFGQSFLRIRALQRERSRGQGFDLSAEREPFAHARKNSAQTRRHDQRLGGRSERDLSLSSRRGVPAFRSRGLRRSAALRRSCPTQARADAARIRRSVRERFAGPRRGSMGARRTKPTGVGIAATVM